MFSKIVPAFSTNNIGTLGMSVMAGPPFNPSTDPNLAVAYVSPFIFVFFMTLFPLGGSRLISRDFVGPEVEDEEMREATRRKRQAILHAWRYLPSYLQPLRQRSRVTDASMGEDVLCEKTPSVDDKSVSSTPLPLPDQACLPQHSPAVGIPADMAPFTSRSPSPSPSLTQVGSVTQAPRPNEVRSEPPHAGSLVAPPPRPRRLHGARTFISGLLSAASLSVILGFAIALITPLKALLVALPGSPIPNAPDGAPPLAFVMDTAAFVGAASVPLGLICLGSALARLKVPRGAWRAMPLGAIGGLAVAKIVVSPVLGVLTCQGLTRAGVIDREDKVLRFVCIFFACMPTATTQVYLTQVYSGTGSAEHISAFLIPQYALMIVMMTILTAYLLNLLF